MTLALQLKTIRILLIEDNADHAFLTRRLLTTQSDSAFKVTHVDTLTEALQQHLTQHEYDVILLDRSLPDSNDLRSIAMIQAVDPHLPIVVLTNYDDEEVALEAVQMGAQDYLVKGKSDANLFKRTIRYAIERQRAETALRHSEQRFRRLLETAPNGIVVANNKGEIVLVNAYVEKLFGYSQDNLLGKSIEILMPEHFRENHVKHREAYQARPTLRPMGIGLELIGQRKDGSQFPVEITLSPLDLDGETHIISTIHDITRRRRTEEALQESDERYQTLARVSPVGIFHTDAQGGYLFANERWCEITGLTLKETLGSSWVHGLHTDDRERVLEEWNRATEFNAAFNSEYRFQHADGTTIWVLGQAIVETDSVGAVTGYIGTIADITEHKRAEDEIKRRNRELTLLHSVITAATSTLNIEEILEVACRELAQAFEMPQTAAILLNEQRTVATVVADYREESRPSTLGMEILLEDIPAAQHIIQNKKPLVVSDAQHDARLGAYRELARLRSVVALIFLPLVVRDKTIGWISMVTGEQRKFSNQEVDLATNVAAAVSQVLHNARLYRELEDYSEFLEAAVKERTTDLKQEKERAEAILESAADAVLTFDSKGHILSATPAFEEQTYYKADEMIGQHARVLTDSSLPRPITDDLLEAINKGYAWRGEIVTRRKDGSEYEVDLNMAPLRGTKKNGALGYVAVMRDISALKQIERMKDAFVANVSHELRTPITSLKLLHYGLQQAKAEDQQRILDMLRRETDRLHHIVEDVLRLSRLDQGQVELNCTAVDLNTLIEEYVLDRAALAEGRLLTLTQNKAQNLPPVQADEGLLGQVLGVFLTNALNYTPEGGRIEVGTAVQKFDAQEWTGFSISDTGPGIPPEEQKRLFERFFRGAIGRESGAPGTGLGLAIADEIVKRHDGRIEVFSTGVPGEGTTFTVWLPTRENIVEIGSL